MTPAPTPGIPPLNDALSPEQLARSFAVVEARLARRRQVRRVAVSAALGVALVALTWAWRGGPSPAASPAEPGPLVAVAGQPMPQTLTSGEQEQTVTLADRSSVRLMPRARLRVHENTGRRLWLKQEQGAVEYEVTPGGPRLWRVDVGGTTVEVLGTHFWVRERQGHVEVEVTRGKVLVKSVELTGGDVLLGAGERVEVGASAPSEGSVGSSGPPDAPPPATLLPTTPPARRLVPTPQAPPPPLAAADEEPSGSFEALLVRSEEAREAGRFEASAAQLRAALSRFPGDARSDIARVALANVLLDRLRAPDEAFQVLDPWLRAHTRSSLPDEGRPRRVDAAVRSGGVEVAWPRHAEFVATFPSSPRLSAVNRWMSTLDSQPPP